MGVHAVRHATFSQPPRHEQIQAQARVLCGMTSHGQTPRTMPARSHRTALVHWHCSDCARSTQHHEGAARRGV